MADQPITVTLSTEQIARLKELATRYGVPIEELARAGIEDFCLPVLTTHSTKQLRRCCRRMRSCIAVLLESR